MSKEESIIPEPRRSLIAADVPDLKELLRSTIPVPDTCVLTGVPVAE